MTIGITLESVNSPSGLSPNNERLPSMSTPTGVANFGTSLEVAQLIGAPTEKETTQSDVSVDDQQASNVAESPSTAQQLLLLSMTFLPPIMPRSDGAHADIGSDSALLSANKSTAMHFTGETDLPQMGQAPVEVPHDDLSVDLQSVSIDEFAFDIPPLDPGRRFTTNTFSPPIDSTFLAMVEELQLESPSDGFDVSNSDLTSNQMTVDAELDLLEPPKADVDHTSTVDLPTGLVSVLFKEVHTNVPHLATPSTHSLNAARFDMQTDLSEIVRHVRTMTSEHETRTTIQLKPVELGRMTLELVDTPEGLRAHVSAEDPTVLRFLERNVQLMESEARLQGVGQMSFSVGADVSGGMGRDTPQQSEAESSLRKTIEFSHTPHKKTRSSRELDTSA